MVDKIAVLAVLAVASVTIMSVYGLPSPPQGFGETADTAATTNHGIHGWLKNMHKKIQGHGHECDHGHGGGGVFHWVKSKLGFAKTSSTAAPTTNVEDDDSGYHHHPETVDIDDHHHYGDNMPDHDDETPAETPAETPSNYDREEISSDGEPVQEGTVDPIFDTRIQM